MANGLLVVPDDPRTRLTEDQRRRLDDGEHEAVAVELREHGEHELAGWVLEQIWDFAGAHEAYQAASLPIEALRMALEDGSASRVDRSLDAIANLADARLIDRAAALLEQRGRAMDAARLFEVGKHNPRRRIEALLRGGDRLTAAAALFELGEFQEAFDVLDLDSPAEHALAAKLAWALGDAEQSAHLAQLALQGGHDTSETYELLARALGSLGHDLAAQIVLEGRNPIETDAGVPGRYRVTGHMTPLYAGAAYVGLDRMTLQEIEIHLLLAEASDPTDSSSPAIAALGRFSAIAQAAMKIDHPALRPIIDIDPRAGLLVLPRAEGVDFRSLIRPPGMAATPSRARGLIAFLLEGLAAAHSRGLVHGWLLPSTIVCDALGRPLLGPFGAYHLAGLTATHTTALEELLAVSAPELNDGSAPTVRSDLFAVGALLHALLTGALSREPADRPTEPSGELSIAEALLAPNPADRPPLREVLAELSRPVADVRDVVAFAAAPELARTSEVPSAPKELGPGIFVEAAPSWSDELLDALCRQHNPWLHPIVDRHERGILLASWPEGSRTLSEHADTWRELVPPEALTFEDPELHAAINERLHADDLVRTPSGSWMIALDGLLLR